MNPDAAKASQLRWRAQNPEALVLKERKRTLRQYGLTPEAYVQLLASQEGTCATCPATTGHNGPNLHVDHCHTTGLVRGLLCHRCNLMLGYANDDPERLRALADYLERTNQAQIRRSKAA